MTAAPKNIYINKLDDIVDKYNKRYGSSRQYGGLMTFLPTWIFFNLEVLGHFELHQVFMRQTLLIFPSIYIINKKN